jgi:hypothetical protein
MPGSSGHNGASQVHVATLEPPKHRVRLPELAVGLLVMATFAIAAAAWHLNAVAKTPALAASRAIERGEVIDPGDLRTVYVASDDSFALVTDQSSIVGKIAVTEMAPGTLLAPSLVAEGAALDADDGVAGLALEPGQYPALGLSPGDRVDVIRSGQASTAGTTRADDQVLTRGAIVFEVEDLASDRKLVSIKASRSDAETVAGAAELGGLRLVLVAP